MRPFRKVVKAVLHEGQTIIKNFHIRWWDVELDCGHHVERGVRYKPGHTRRGWGMIHRPPSLTNVQDFTAKRLQCDRCPKERNQ